MMGTNASDTFYYVTIQTFFTLKLVVQRITKLTVGIILQKYYIIR